MFFCMKRAGGSERPSKSVSSECCQKRDVESQAFSREFMIPHLGNPILCGETLVPMVTPALLAQPMSWRPQSPCRGPAKGASSGNKLGCLRRGL